MIPPLWLSQDIARATGGIEQGSFTANGVAIDTRKLQPGDLFIALSGKRVDGHDFVDSAMAAGAAGVLVERAVDAPHIRVKSVPAALTALGQAGRDRFEGTLIGITGSVGKTTLRALASAALAAYGQVEATKGNLNNQLGVPLTLANLSPTSAYAVIEMGMNQPGEIAALTRLARPHAAMVTAIAESHSAYFDSLAAIADAKAEIFQGLTGRRPLALYPGDSPFTAQLQREIPGRAISLTFGESANCEVELLAYEGASSRFRVGEERVRLRPRLLGRHNARNLAAALSLIKALGLPIGPALPALEAVAALPGRGQEQRLALASGGSLRVINDAYNAAPASIDAMLKTLAEQEVKGRRIALLGDMSEQANPEKSHRDLVFSVAESPPDLLLSLGFYMAELYAASAGICERIHFQTLEDLAARLPLILSSEDLLWAKASNASGLGAWLETKAKEGF